jgi:hypothetical protein
MSSDLLACIVEGGVSRFKKFVADAEVPGWPAAMPMRERIRRLVGEDAGARHPHHRLTKNVNLPVGHGRNLFSLVPQPALLETTA